VPLYIKREGSFFGQCSELCGAQHGFMPIVVSVVDPEMYASFGFHQESVIDQLKKGT
jgi:cytochrome c oxidase subunit 2